MIFWVRLSDGNHESNFLTDDKFKLPPNWVSWGDEQNDNAGGNEHHVIAVIKHRGEWLDGEYWDVNEEGMRIAGDRKLTVCERNVPGEYIFRETVMSGKECAKQCSNQGASECENFCGKGGTCFGDKNTGSIGCRYCYTL